MWYQTTIHLSARKRGFHLITKEILTSLPEIHNIQTGLCHLLLKHTSASLTINENADPSVRQDFEAFFNRHIPENMSFLTHTLEGPDDMPAHLKSSILGAELTLPITGGKFNLGTWQGIYLCEHRDYGGERKILATIMGE